MFKEKHGIRDEDMCVLEEIGFRVGAIKSKMAFTGPGKRLEVQRTRMGNCEIMSAVQALGAEGWATPPFIVTAGDSNIPRGLMTYYQTGS
jgi:hypothetical protein